ncbi:MerR family transcriptional regulator [Mycolicibacterium vaccae]|uniref:MerR family transcriptional regulator n=1 Tax=Mycolicibacterium vaccae TaxID=1810 RepID=UPI003D0924C6
MAEYRLEDLARVSGVSARNIRAYRERGLLDPPRRVGRSALYDDYHLSQLHTISQLLRKGFNSAHIAEFFESMRHGADLADILGLQRAVLGPREGDGDDRPPDTGDLDLRPDSEEARGLVSYGLAKIDDGEVIITDGVIADILARAQHPMSYIRALLKFLDSADVYLDALAEGFVETLGQLYAARVGADQLPKRGDAEEIQRMLQDYQAIGAAAMASRFEEVSRRHLVTESSDYVVEILATGAWRSDGNLRREA